MMEEDIKARQRMQVIVEHLAGRMNATQAAQALGVSRKTFYEWLERARAAMSEALRDRAGGRPGKPEDAQKAQLQAELESLKKDRQVLEARLMLKDVIQETLDAMQGRWPGSKKKRDEPS